MERPTGGSSIAVLIAGIILLNGCTGLKPYRSDHENNLLISTQTDSGFFSNVRTAVDIYSVDANCTTKYQGTVKLNELQVAVGLGTNETSYLVFTFTSSAFLSNSHGTTSYDTMVRPRAGYNYDVSVSYRDNIYNVSIRERNLAGPKSRELLPALLGSCRELS